MHILKLTVAIVGVAIISGVAIYFIYKVHKLRRELIEQPEPDIVLAEEIRSA